MAAENSQEWRPLPVCVLCMVWPAEPVSLFYAIELIEDLMGNGAHRVHLGGNLLHKGS